MFEKLSREEVREALDEMIDKMGVKETVSLTAFKDHFKNRDKQGWIEEIAKLLDLPVRINMSIASADYREENARRFTSSAMVETDKEHRGRDGIIAQVTVPKYMPMWGTPDLHGYEIEVLVSENCLDRPDTFITIMAHELSHILLAAIRSPHKESEFHTDLVPILLGFADYVRLGRKYIYTTTEGSATTTHTITYGYLSDEIFSQASEYVKSFLGSAQNKKKRLGKMAGRAGKALNEASIRQEAFKDYFAKIDTSRPQKMKTEHAQRLVALHGQDTEGEWTAYCAAAKKKLEDASALLKNLSRYTKQAAAELDEKTGILENMTKELDRKAGEMLKDTKMMRKYIKK